MFCCLTNSKQIFIFPQKPCFNGSNGVNYSVYPSIIIQSMKTLGNPIDNRYVLSIGLDWQPCNLRRFLSRFCQLYISSCQFHGNSKKLLPSSCQINKILPNPGIHAMFFSWFLPKHKISLSKRNSTKSELELVPVIVP